MSEIARLLDSLKSLKVENEDGESVSMETRPGLSDSALLEYERTMGEVLPQQFRDLMACSNGMSFFGLHIMSSAEQIWHREQGILAFHNWGNGDFDGVSVASQRFGAGEIVFMNHSPDVAVKVGVSLLAWFGDVSDEIQERGVLLHPDDFRRTAGPGVYRHVLDELQGVDCELNG